MKLQSDKIKYNKLLRKGKKFNQETISKPATEKEMRKAVVKDGLQKKILRKSFEYTVLNNPASSDEPASTSWKREQTKIKKLITLAIEQGLKGSDEKKQAEGVLQFGFDEGYKYGRKEVRDEIIKWKHSEEQDHPVLEWNKGYRAGITDMGNGLLGFIDKKFGVRKNEN